MRLIEMRIESLPNVCLCRKAGEQHLKKKATAKKKTSSRRGRAGDWETLRGGDDEMGRGGLFGLSGLTIYWAWNSVGLSSLSPGYRIGGL